jgi:hypothetical protein
MNTNLFSNHKFEILLFLLLYFSLIVGFAYDENALGGSMGDYLNQKRISAKFSNNFYETFLNYNKETSRHSPILIILFSFFEKFKINDFAIRLFNIHFMLLIIYFFYKSLKLKINYLDKNKIVLISLVIFLSPTFRSLSIWPDSRLYGVLFFVISIIFFFKFENSQKYIDKYKNSMLNIFFVAVSSYFSPNFFLFYFFFIYFFLKSLKFNEILKILIFSFFIALPAIYYVFVLKIFFFLTPVTEKTQTILSFNIANKIVIISSIFFFYYLPFLTVTNKNFNLSTRNLLISLSLIVILIFFFNYKSSFTGGGIIFKASNILFKNNYLLYLFSFAGLILLLTMSNKSPRNLAVILLLVTQNPQLEIYHKYYDPILFILFFTLFDIKFNKKLLKKRVFIFYLFYIFFLIVNFYR